ncbi:MAG TPA: hypothetical protein VGQ12_15195 [Candidatus Angelobacter sp.]|jgi:hypothetical protein|nr:hypothetical protein [Candidatus Angelobacter sp.]
MFHGVNGEYRWLETAAHEVYDVLQVCPAVAASKNVVITSFDSYPLQPTSEEMQRGWRVSGRSVHIPVGDNIAGIPFEVFNEWYIFNSDSPEREYKVFVKYDWFTLGPAQALYSRNGNAFDLKRMQRWFWQELEQANPESYLGRGSRLKFVTKNAEHFNTVLRGLSSLARIRAMSAKAPA